MINDFDVFQHEMKSFEPPCPSKSIINQKRNSLITRMEDGKERDSKLCHWTLAEKQKVKVICDMRRRNAVNVTRIVAFHLADVSSSYEVLSE